MDINRFRRLAAEVDHDHRATMRELRRSRRGFLVGGGALTLGAAAAAVPVLAHAAGAQQATTTTTQPSATTVPATTTTPPRRPTPSDVSFLVFAQSLELAVAEAYQVALDSNRLGTEIASVVRIFQVHHREHGEAFGGAASKSATGRPNAALLAEYEPRFRRAGTERDLLRVAFELENAAAASYVDALGTLTGTDAAQLVASVSPIEARHATVLGTALDLPLATVAPAVEDPARGIDPTRYPVQEQ